MASVPMEIKAELFFKNLLLIKANGYCTDSTVLLVVIGITNN
jgi:hypothetical protein